MEDLPKLDWESIPDLSDLPALPWLQDAYHQDDTFMQPTISADNIFCLSQAPQAPIASTSALTQIPDSSATSLPPIPSPEQTSKKSRTRSAYATSCASCRLRKVKCIRTNSDGPCNSCSKKSIRCINVEAPLSKKRNSNGRSGNRIEFAKQAFGETDLPTQSQLSISPSTEESAPSLSPSSTAARMDDMQISACFCSALVDSYYACPYFQQPCLDWNELRHRFTSVGYRLNEMPEETQALMAVVIATASRVAVHEDIIGTSGLNSMTVLPLPEGVDLSAYGKGRDATCRALEREARKKILQSNLLLQPSPEAVAALYLEFTLQNTTFNSDGTEGKQLIAIAATHLRSLHEHIDQGPQTRLYSDNVNLTLCIADTMTASRIGSAFALTDDDVKLFLRSATSKDVEISEGLVHELIADPTWQNSARVTEPVWYGFLKMSRKLVSTITGPLARVSALNVQEVHDFYSTWDKLWNFSACARCHLQASSHLGQPVQAAAQHLEMTKCAFLHALMACDHALATRANGAIIEHDEQETLQALRAISRKRMIQGSKDLATHLELLAGMSSNITLASTIQILQMSFGEWTDLLQEATTASEGGPADFDYVAKIRALNAYITTYKALSYSWPQFHDSAASLTAVRDELRSKLCNQLLLGLPDQSFSTH